MDVFSTYRQQPFVWDSVKAASNLKKHRISFDQACAVLFDQFHLIEDASTPEEERDAAIGVAEDESLLFVVISRTNRRPRASSRPAPPPPMKGDAMKTANERFRQRLRKNRPMTTISIRIPNDVIEDLKEIAPAFGFSGYQPLIRAYIGQGMRKHEMELEKSTLTVLAGSLRRKGVTEDVIAAAIEEARLTPA